MSTCSGGESSDAVVRLIILWTIDSIVTNHPAFKGGGSLSSLVQLSTSINVSPVRRLLPPHAIIPRVFRFRAGQRSYMACGAGRRA